MFPFITLKKKSELHLFILNSFDKKQDSFGDKSKTKCNPFQCPSFVFLKKKRNNKFKLVCNVSDDEFI